MSKGYLIFDEEEKATTLLVRSIRKHMGNVSIAVMSSSPSQKEQYLDDIDYLIEFKPVVLKRGESTLLKSQAYACTPFDETIVLDSNMVMSSDISWWWEFLSSYDLLFCSRVLNYRGEVITQDPSRNWVKKNRLPDIHASLIYFRKSDIAEVVFSAAGVLAKNWDTYWNEKLSGAIGFYPTNDPVFACALKETGYQRETITPHTEDWFTFTDMNMHAQDASVDTDHLSYDWTDHLRLHVDQNGSMVVNQYLQQYPLRHGIGDGFFYTENTHQLLEKNIL